MDFTCLRTKTISAQVSSAFLEREPSFLQLVARQAVGGEGALQTAESNSWAKNGTVAGTC